MAAGTAGAYPASSARASRTASSKPIGASLIPGGGGDADEHLGAQSLHQRARDAGVDRGHEAQPVRRQPRREHRYAHHQRRAPPGHGGVAAHHLAVAEDVGAAELDLARRVPRRVGERRQGADDVADRDRLGARVDPARADHRRQAVDEVAQDQERGAAGADDHRRARVDGVGHRARPGSPRPPRGCAGARSRRPPGRRGRRSAPRRRRCAARAKASAPARSRCGEAAIAAAAHRVHEVVGDVDALERRRERGLVEDVALDDLGLARAASRGSGRAPGSARPGRAAAARARGGRRRSRWLR